MNHFAGGDWLGHSHLENGQKKILIILLILSNKFL